MTKRRFRVISGGDNRGSGSDDVAQRVLCRDCRFREVRLFKSPFATETENPSSLVRADACMVNGQERAALHNPEGLCTKFESAADAFVADTRRLVLRLCILGGTMLGAVLMSIIWLCFG